MTLNHGNRSWCGMKHPTIKLGSKYHSPNLIYLSIMVVFVISSLDKIYCKRTLKDKNKWVVKQFSDLTTNYLICIMRFKDYFFFKRSHLELHSTGNEVWYYFAFLAMKRDDINTFHGQKIPFSFICCEVLKKRIFQRILYILNENHERRNSSFLSLTLRSSDSVQWPASMQCHSLANK